MFSNQLPIFNRGSILKKEMLKNLRDYPRNLVNLYLADYSDGILAGSDLEIKGKEIIIKPGIIKYKQQLYLLNESKRLTYQATNQERLIKIKFDLAEENGGFKEWNSELYLTSGEDIATDELELGRFKLREGANLRTDYNQFSDFSTEYNTVNIINVKYSSVGKATLHPDIINFFANKILTSDTDNQFDISFALQALQSQVVNRNLIKKYLMRKLELRQDSYTNLEIYQYLSRIIRRLSDYQIATPEAKSDNKILID
ncbi:MAG: DNA and RNA helicase [Bacillota bacterium]